MANPVQEEAVAQLPQDVLHSLPLVRFLDNSVSIEERAAEALASTISTANPFPVFFEGSEGINTLLECLTSREGLFEANESAPEGVFAWPHHFPVGEGSLLLLNLRRKTSGAKGNQKKMRREVKAGFMALSSIWCICEKKRKRVLKAVNAFAEDYEKIKQKFDVKISKVFVFFQETWFKTEKHKNKKAAALQTHPDLFVPMHRGNENSEEDKACLASFATQLAQVATHDPYMRSHDDVYKGNFSTRFLHFSKVFTKIISLNFSFERFVDELPDLHNPSEEIDNHCLKLKVAVERAHLISTKGRALAFITQECIGESYLPVFDETVLDKLQETYLKQETVVLSVMGLPGSGKSTLLNNIIRFCTKTPELPSIFRTGSTPGHTTRDSQVLSHPLFFKEQQLMLIDLEGLGGTELKNQAKRKAQQKLVDAIMTVTSALAIVVNNDEQKLQNAKRDIEKLQKLHASLGFVTERVLLLFHDINSAGKNDDFVQAVKEMNMTLFNGREVVKILNKPNFEKADESTRFRFLQDLLDDCLVSKKSQDDKCVNIQELLTYLSVIARNEYDSLADLLSRSQDAEKDSIVQRKCKVLKWLADEIVSSDNEHLVQEYEARVKEQFDTALKDELARKSEGIRSYCRTQLDLEARKHKKELLLRETNFSLLMASPNSEAYIDQIVDCYQKSAWCVIDFMSSTKALKTMLKKIKGHFPQQTARMSALIKRLKEATSRKRNQMLLKYAGTALVLVFAALKGFPSLAELAGPSSGLDLPPLEAHQGALQCGAPVGEIPLPVEPTMIQFGDGLAEPLGAEIACERSFGLATNQPDSIIQPHELPNSIEPKESFKLVMPYYVAPSNQTFAGNSELLLGTSSFLFQLHVAEKLLSVKGRGSEVNPLVMEQLCSKSSSAPVLLCIGSKATSVAEFASTFVRRAVPFIPTAFKAFDSNRYAQILSFEYLHPSTATGSRAYLICLRMKKKTTSKYALEMARIAETLLPAASLTCILSDRTHTYVEQLLNALLQVPVSSTTIPEMKLLHFTLARQSTEQMGKAFFKAQKIPAQTRYVQEFSCTTAEVFVEEIKREFDTTQARSSEVLLEQLRALQGHSE